MTMIGKLIRFGRRQLHTVISKEIIKPSSPTPSHLKTHNLSFLDQAMINTFMPFVTFYPNTGIYPASSHDKTLDLKKSLSQTLTKYYPFAGRLAKVAPSFVDCNDHGAEFLEASIDSTLSDFLQNSKHEDLDQFFPHGLVNQKSNRADDDDLQSDEASPLAIQVNHFECGGLAVAMSLSHKVADGSSVLHFLGDWAKMTQLCSSDQMHEFANDPQFIPFEYKNLNYSGFSLGSDECITRSFMFPNAKINKLKLEINAMIAESGQPIKTPSRVEALTWLLYKSAVAAATKNNSGIFKPTGVGQLTNMRSRFMEPLPEKSIGNYFMIMDTLTHNESEMNPKSFFSEHRKQKTMFQGIRNIQTAFDILAGITVEEGQRKFDDVYLCSSLCRYPTYDIDFGWGKPLKATVAGDLRRNSFIMMDARNRDGVEVLVCLGKEDMAIVQSSRVFAGR